MNNELLARAQLFAAIEGGSEFWTNEISTLGAEQVREKLIASGYQDSKSSGAKITERLVSLKGEEVLGQIEKAGAYLLIPSDLEWPIQLADLAAPPIALLVKGERQFLSRLGDSIAIVGTRNPTN